MPYSPTTWVEGVTTLGPTNLNKIEAVREALKHELERQRGKPSVVDLAVRFSRELRARGKPKRGRRADKRFFDELSGNE